MRTLMFLSHLDFELYYLCRASCVGPDMELLTVEQIKVAASERFTSEQLEMIGFSLRSSPLTREQIRQFEQRLHMPLPVSFAEFLLKFDLSDVDLGGIFFSTGGNYLEILEVENLGGSKWWGFGGRPTHLLLIASTDGYIILLDIQTGVVYSVHDEDTWGSRRKIAPDFLTSVEAVGTLFFLYWDRKTEVGQEIAQQLGADPLGRFWNSR